MILITGAAGKTGKALLRILSEQGKAVKALVFRSEQIRQAEALGAKEVVVGDMRDSDFVQTVMQDVHSVYHICPNIHPEEISIGQIVIDAAALVGITHFVYHSVLHPQIEAMPHHWKKMRVEERLSESGLPFTILQPAVYMQNILSQWKEILETGRYVVPYSVESRISMVDLEDVALAASNILGDDVAEGRQSPHCGATYELVGTQAMSHKEVAMILSQQLNRPVDAESVSIDTWEREVRSSGLSNYQVKTLVKMFEYYEKFGFVGNTNVLNWLLNRPTTNFGEFIRRVAKERLDSVLLN